MARRKNDSLKRKPANRSYRNVCWVSTEGETERDYFSMAVFRQADVSVRFLQRVHPGRTNPAQVLKRFKDAIRSEDFRKGDEAWLVVDVDEWDEGELRDLVSWKEKDARHHLAVSNPKFELFLVMHFERAGGCTTAQAVDASLRKHLPRYKKRLSLTTFDRSQVERAIENASLKRHGCTNEIPDRGMTDAHRLAKRLLDGER